MYQTLVLVPGQHAIFLEHNTKNEAQLVLCNVKNANALHNGDIVTAIPLNYADETDRRIQFFIDVGDIPEDQKEVFVKKIKEQIAHDLELNTKGQA